LYKLQTELDQTGTAVDCKPGSGKKRKKRTAQNVNSSEELVLSKNAPSALKSVRVNKLHEFPKRQCIGSKLL